MYQWYLNDIFIEETDRDYSGSKTNHLIIHSCFSKHEGEYKCEIRHEEVSAVCQYSNPASLKLGKKVITYRRYVYR